MPIVRIFDHEWVNPDAVGAVKHQVEIVGEEERERTDVLNFAGERLATLVTAASASDQSELELRRAMHREVIAALKSGRDAKTVQDLLSNKPF